MLGGLLAALFITSGDGAAFGGGIGLMPGRTVVISNQMDILQESFAAIGLALILFIFLQLVKSWRFLAGGLNQRLAQQC